MISEPCDADTHETVEEIIETPKEFWLTTIHPAKIARNRYWLYIIEAFNRNQEFHCEILISGLPGIIGLPAWVYALYLDRPYIVGSLESPALLYDNHFLETGTTIRFRTEHIRHVLLTCDSA